MKIRVPLVVLPNGKWSTYGWHGGSDKENFGTTLDMLDDDSDTYTVYWLEFEKPEPKERVISPLVKEGGE